MSLDDQEDEETEAGRGTHIEDGHSSSPRSQHLMTTNEADPIWDFSQCLAQIQIRTRGFLLRARQTAERHDRHEVAKTIDDER